MSDETNNELSALQQIISALQVFDDDTKIKILKTTATFFKIDALTSTKTFTGKKESSETIGQSLLETKFSDHQVISPKQFLLDKNPRTDVERVACLAFYLTHYRNTQYFKTLDISKLNTEAAQPKFSNPAQAVDNATKCGYLVPGTKGNKQISAIGERFVQALPNRDAARDIVRRSRPRRIKKTETK